MGSLFTETIGRSRRMLNQIGEEHQAGLSPRNAEALERGLANSARHYTMQVERDLHEGFTKAVAGVAPVAARTEQSELPPVEVDELGENVEFF